MEIKVNWAREIGRLNHFWRSTGFTPAKLLLGADMRQAITYLGSIPHQGITYVRIHYLLDLLTGKDFSAKNPVYNWSQLDVALDLLIDNGLKPFFELMGNPSGYFTDFLNDTQLHAWRRLVQALAQHYIERYGQEEVESWYFETWNEPDIPFWGQSIPAFCNYYDACSEGLKEANPNLRLGGPGTAKTLSDMFKAFLNHCQRGKNYFSGETGIRLDFISVHEKGVKSCVEDLNPNTQQLCSREIQSIKYIRSHHPCFAELPFINNECDPQVGWKDVHTWRACPYYAALVCKVINQHLGKIIDELGCPFTLLSNDNGFLGRWGKRTQLARFGNEENLEREEFEMIKKPVHNVMTMLSLLGNLRLDIEGIEDVFSNLGAIATKRGKDQVAVLIYNSRDQIRSSGREKIELSLEKLPFKEAMLIHYCIDENHGNPFKVWEEMGAPENPSAEQFAILRKNQELALLEKPRMVTIKGGKLKLEFDLLLPGVSLILLSSKPKEVPGKVKEVRAEKYKGLIGKEEILLSWKGVNSRFIRTYEVLFANSPDGPFKRINESNLLCTAFLQVRGNVKGRGFYKVRAIDYWGRQGEDSQILKV